MSETTDAATVTVQSTFGGMTTNSGFEAVVQSSCEAPQPNRELSHSQDEQCPSDTSGKEIRTRGDFISLFGY